MGGHQGFPRTWRPTSDVSRSSTARAAAAPAAHREAAEHVVPGDDARVAPRGTTMCEASRDCDIPELGAVDGESPRPGEQRLTATSRSSSTCSELALDREPDEQRRVQVTRCAVRRRRGTWPSSAVTAGSTMRADR